MPFCQRRKKTGGEGADVRPGRRSEKKTKRTKGRMAARRKRPNERGRIWKRHGAERHVCINPPRDLLISNSNSQASNSCEVENERSWETDSPGPPFGPRYLSTATVFSPFLISPFSTASTKASSVSNVLAFPVNSRPSFPVILATAPPGARLPFRILQINNEPAK